MQSAENRYRKIDDLIARYISDGLDRDAFDTLRQWCKDSPEHQQYVREQMKKQLLTRENASADQQFDSRRAYKAFLRRIASEQFEQKTVITRRRIRRRLSWAAAVVLLLLLPFVGYIKGKKDVKSGFEQITVEAPLGSFLSMSLPDGTKVWLNAGSRLIYSQGFGIDTRCLELKGEGFFEVVKNTDKPFIVHTNEMNVQVVGTKFNVRNYQEDEEATVDLLEGRVFVVNKLCSRIQVMLEPNERFVLKKPSGEMKKMRWNTETAKSWTRNKLLFDEALLDDIAKQLSRSFDVQIVVADSLRNRRFYGDFKVVGNTAEEVLSTLSKTGQMRYRYENGKYVIY